MKKILTATLITLWGTSLMAADGQALAQKCQACHGVHFDKHALGESPDISTYSKAKLIGELREFQTENENDKLFQTMKAQVKDFNTTDIEAVAAYISSLKK